VEMKTKNKTLLSASVVALLANTSVSAESNPFKITNLENGYANQSSQLVSSSMHGNKNPESSCGASHMKMNDGKCGGSMGMSDDKKQQMKKHMKEEDKVKDEQVDKSKDE
tara:strand:+ start:692 stop:1021 length:330 start_codon:yes stop_codon:yes gene_type:complete